MPIPNVRDGYSPDLVVMVAKARIKADSKYWPGREVRMRQWIWV